jgi:hypothetical protein
MAAVQALLSGRAAGSTAKVTFRKAESTGEDEATGFREKRRGQLW